MHMYFTIVVSRYRHAEQFWTILDNSKQFWLVGVLNGSVQIPVLDPSSFGWRPPSSITKLGKFSYYYSRTK